MPTPGPLPDNTSQIMAQALRQQMPDLKTQVQFTAFMAGFDAFRLLCNSIFSGDQPVEVQARDAFEKSLESMRVATKLSNQFQEIPATDRSPSASQFIDPPSRFTEYDSQKELLVELGRVSTTEELNSWYSSTRDRREKIVTQSLRNVLFDEIRSKRDELTRLSR